MPCRSGGCDGGAVVTDPHAAGPARVLLADRHHQFLAALRSYLDTLPGVLVVAQATTADATMDAAESAAPDVVLVDLELCVGTLLVKALDQLAPRPRVVVASLANDPAYADQALRLGADAWVAKDDLTRIQSVLTDRARHG
jgi:DNA-binding NarL/FixJ family response regulator